MSVNLPCVQQSISRWLSAWQAAEQGRLVPWLAVFAGSGVLCYFALRSEPPVWLGLTIAVPAVSGALLIRRHPVLRATVTAVSAAAIGFGSAQFATLRAPLQPVLPTHAIVLTGNVRSVEVLPEGRRIGLDGVTLEDSGEQLERWLRVRLKKGDAQEVAAGDVVRLRALIRPPMPPASATRGTTAAPAPGTRLGRWSVLPNGRRVRRCAWCSGCVGLSRSIFWQSCPARLARCRSPC